VISLLLGSQEHATVQILPGPGLAPLAPNLTPPVVIVAAPAAPLEPARRVTANGRGGAGDLVLRQAARARMARGRLVDLLV
jgi:hypothetical protein